ncbi:MAG: DUF3786 domain-containing protein [Bacillota bacterium]
MKSEKPVGNIPELNSSDNQAKREQSLKERCEQYKTNLKNKDPQVIARQAAVSFVREKENNVSLCGTHFNKEYKISWPKLTVTENSGENATPETEALWLHYLNRADGHPLSGRWVNLSEIGGLFYQRAFQGYSGDMLAKFWGSNLESLEKACRANGGWALPNLADLAFEWRALPRMPICLCYLLPKETKEAWATILFDAASKHYVAADVAAIVGKKLADRLEKFSDEE